MQTITTRVLPATNTKPTRIKAETSSGKSYICSVDKYDSIEDAHRGTAFALMLDLKWTGIMVGGDTKEGKTWVFFDRDAEIISNDAAQVLVTIDTGNAAFTDSQHELARIFGLLRDSASLEDLLSNKIYDINGNNVGYIKLL